MLNKRLAILFLLQIANASSFSQTVSYFPELTKKLVYASLNTFICYDKGTTTFYNIPCHLLKKTDPSYTEDLKETGGMLVARYKNATLKDSLTILFETGPSDDPLFSVFTKEKKLLLKAFCLGFYINAAGVIYTTGHTNNMYDCRRKFQIQQNEITEIKQPFNYVGLKGNTKKPIVLYQSTTGEAEVAKLPKNSPIEILLAEPADNDKMDKLFLVKSNFGLVGWLRINDEDIFSAIIDGLFFAGD